MGLSSSKTARIGQTNFSADTAVAMEYDMWVMPLHEFVQLSVLLPHQELIEQGKLARRIPSMKTVVFLSHRKFAAATSSPLRAHATPPPR